MVAPTIHFLQAKRFRLFCFTAFPCSVVLIRYTSSLCRGSEIAKNLLSSLFPAVPSVRRLLNAEFPLKYVGCFSSSQSLFNTMHMPVYQVGEYYSSRRLPYSKEPTAPTNSIISGASQV